MASPPFVADSLPDRFGNAMIRAYMSREGLAQGKVTPLDKLAYMGRRSMGALEFHPMLDVGDSEPSALDMAELVEEARISLNGDFSGAIEDLSMALKRLMQVGSSAGGARSKAVIGWNPETGCFVSGQFDVPEGYEHWIIKFSFDSMTSRPGEFGKVEYAYSLMAADCGIVMSECRLQEIAGGMHFITKRFDRIGHEKVHLQTLCAMDGLDFAVPHVHDYSQLFDVANRLDLGYAAVDELFSRMVFNFCMENNDDHPKNFSFMLREGGDWQLAPAYDLTFAHDSGSEWLDSHQMSVNGKFSGASREDLVRFGRRYNVAGPQDCIDRILGVASKWPKYAKKANVSASETERIGKFIDKRMEELG